MNTLFRAGAVILAIALMSFLVGCWGPTEPCVPMVDTSLTEFSVDSAHVQIIEVRTIACPREPLLTSKG